jgi:hypothetical protein
MRPTPTKNPTPEEGGVLGCSEHPKEVYAAYRQAGTDAMTECFPRIQVVRCVSLNVSTYQVAARFLCPLGAGEVFLLLW